MLALNTFLLAPLLPGKRKTRFGAFRALSSERPPAECKCALTVGCARAHKSASLANFSLSLSSALATQSSAQLARRISLHEFLSLSRPTLCKFPIGSLQTRLQVSRRALGQAEIETEFACRSERAREKQPTRPDSVLSARVHSKPRRFWRWPGGALGAATGANDLQPNSFDYFTGIIHLGPVFASALARSTRGTVRAEKWQSSFSLNQSTSEQKRRRRHSDKDERASAI